MFFGNIFIVCFIFLQTTFGVDVDYYYSAAMRSRTLSCKNSLQQMYCQIKCGVKSAFCIQDACYCLSLTESENYDSEPQIDKPRSDINEDVDFVDGYEPYMVQHESPDADQIFFSLRPTLRHHIAHFCPNLDVARECINKCMKQGKPAFCGKDHVCYCGHKYSANDDNTKTNVKDIYSEFRDLYAKYFGTDVSPNLSHQSNDSDEID